MGQLLTRCQYQEDAAFPKDHLRWKTEALRISPEGKLRYDNTEEPERGEDISARRTDDGRGPVPAAPLPPPRQDMPTLDALRGSSKGRLKYDAGWLERGEDVLAGYDDAPGVFPLSRLVLSRLGPRSQQKSCSLGSVSRDSVLSPLSVSSLSSTTPQENGFSTSLVTPSTKTEDHDSVGKNAPGEALGSVQRRDVLSLLSPKATRVAGRLRVCEEKRQVKARAELDLRQETQRQLSASAADAASEQLKRFEELRELKRCQERQSEMDAPQDKREAEEESAVGRHNKLMEEQKLRIEHRQREAEQRLQEEADAERQRQADEEGRERLRRLEVIQEEILQLNQLVEPKTAADVPSHGTSGEQLCSQVSEALRRTTDAGEFPSEDEVTAATLARQEMQALVRMTQEAGETKRKEEEEARRRKQAEQEQKRKKKASISATEEEAARDGALRQAQGEDGTLRWYRELQDAAARCARSFQDLSEPQDLQTKTLRRELQKAATIPVSQISCESGSRLRQIHGRLSELLRGGASASQHPGGPEYVAYKLAEKLVSQGEVEVASHHEAAFPIAAVALGLWETHPRVGELFLAHLHKRCPYAVPIVPAATDATSAEERRRLLGYRADRDEGQDAFLKRMSGMMRLYAAVMQQRGGPFAPAAAPHPHGLKHAWRWLAQTLNGEPLADVTATLLFDFLEVCGHALARQYQGQFWKLLQLLRDDFLPRVEAVSSGGAGQAAPVARLRELVEAALASRRMVLPKGQLSSAFWKS